MFLSSILFVSHTFWDIPNRKLGQKIKEKEKKHRPPDGVIGAGTESWGIVVEATVENGTAVHELASERVGAGVVQSDALSIIMKFCELRNERIATWQDVIGGALPCPMRRRAGDRCGWRSGGWKCRLKADWRARGLGSASGQRSLRYWATTIFRVFSDWDWELGFEKREK